MCIFIKNKHILVICLKVTLLNEALTTKPMSNPSTPDNIDNSCIYCISCEENIQYSTSPWNTFVSIQLSISINMTRMLGSETRWAICPLFSLNSLNHSLNARWNTVVLMMADCKRKIYYFV